MPSNANSWVGKTDVPRGVFSAQRTGGQGREVCAGGSAEFSCEEDGARCMAPEGRRQKGSGGRGGNIPDRVESGLVYEALSLSQYFCSIALGVSLNGHLVSPALF